MHAQCSETVIPSHADQDRTKIPNLLYQAGIVLAVLLFLIAF